MRTSIMRSRKGLRGFVANTAVEALFALLMMSMHAVDQWLDYPTPDMPRTPDGKPNLLAPVPRTSDGRPDFSGIWQLDKNPFRYLNNITADFVPGEPPTQPWAEALTKERMAGAQASESPAARCLPPGIPILDSS